jgi:hypothetical protein
MIHTMIRRIGAVAVIAAFVLLAGHAAEADNATALPPNDKSSLAQGNSFFEGTWVGQWRAFRNPSDSQDVTLIIRKGDAEGVLFVEYTRGDPPATGTGFPPAGSLKAKGKEDGDKLVFNWQDKSGNDVMLTLTKVEDSKVKARQERTGVIGPKQRPYIETYLNRQ